MINPSIPDHLRQIIRRKEVIVVAGAGVSVSASSGHEVSSWKGLLKSGIDHCRYYGHPRLNGDDIQHLLEILESNDTDNWLGIATLIERKLKYPASREWAKWLKETVGSLPLRSTNLIESILDLELPIITTNYDDLFSRKELSRRLYSIDWKSGFFDEYFFDSPLEYIFHLHGSVINPKSVVLGVSSYSDVLNETFVQNFTHLLSLYKGLLFVGFGAGFDDPNFSSLLNFISENGSLHRHYILVRSCDVDDYSHLTNIYPISYGEEYHELPNFLRTLPFGEERYVYSRKKGYGEIINDLTVFRDLPHCSKMVIVPSGHYLKNGSKVEITRRFAISQTPITVKEWEVFCSERGATYRKFIGNLDKPDLPVVGITYYDAQQYCIWLSEITGHSYRLPSEEEWEYCALGGATTEFWWGNEPDTHHANYRESNIGTTTVVKTYDSNKYHIYDLNGNIWEWCSDSKDIPVHGNIVQEQILKGGCFYYDSSYLSPFSNISLEKDTVFNSVGLRVARDLGVTIQDMGYVYIVSLVGFYALTCKPEETKVKLTQFDMGTNQQWQIIKLSDDTYGIKSSASDRFLSASEEPRDYDCIELAVENSGQDSIKWIFKRASGGYILSLSGNSVALDVDGGRTRSTPELITFQEHGNFNQIWNFVPVK